MSIAPVSSIPSTVPSLNPIMPIMPIMPIAPPAPLPDHDGTKDSKVQPSPSAGTGGQVDVRA